MYRIKFTTRVKNAEPVVCEVENFKFHENLLLVNLKLNTYKVLAECKDKVWRVASDLNTGIEPTKGFFEHTDLEIEEVEQEFNDTEAKVLLVFKLFSRPAIGLIASFIAGIASYRNNWNAHSNFSIVMAFTVFLMQLSIYPHIKKALQGYSFKK